MNDDEKPSSVTLIFYELDRNWSKEPFLNLLASFAQNSKFTHVEVAIGEDHAAGGAMTNVLRIFNDSTGAELASRTGRNPSFTYLSLGCTKRAERAMLAFAKKQVGKPFSGAAMARSLIWPRTTTNWWLTVQPLTRASSLRRTNTTVPVYLALRETPGT